MSTQRLTRVSMQGLKGQQHLDSSQPRQHRLAPRSRLLHESVCVRDGRFSLRLEGVLHQGGLWAHIREEGEEKNLMGFDSQGIHIEFSAYILGLLLRLRPLFFFVLRGAWRPAQRAISGQRVAPVALREGHGVEPS